MTLTHIVAAAEDGMTLEALLRGPLALSARQAREAKRENRITVDGSAMFSNQRVHAGQTVRVELAGYAPRGVQREECAPGVRVLYEDGALLAVHKPAMLQCHPSPSAPRGSDTLEARVRAYLGADAHPVHRLDAETRGIVLFAKLPYAQAHLQAQMRAGSFSKAYRAWLFGAPEREAGEIDAPIAREAPESFTRVVRGDGQRAVSRYAVLQRRELLGRAAALAELRPVTGRTHQLRVHMAHIGCPLLGDFRYGSEASTALSRALGLERHQLAAVSLRFVHPLTGEAVLIEDPAEFDPPLG